MTRVQNNLKIGVSAAAILATFAAFSPAFSGAFALREQSAYYQGMSYAGAAAGNELSSMFWNSAAAAAAPGFNTESHAALIIPDSTLEATGGVFAGAGLNPESGDIGDGVVLPASYANYQLNERLFLGLAINTPFGLGTKPDNTNWAGSPLAVTSEVFSINVNPTVAYKLTDTLTIGVGAQLQYIDVRLTNENPLNGNGRTLEGDDFGFGGTAGVIWKPVPGTQIGLGYRSAIEVNLEGDFNGFSNSIVTPGQTRQNVTADFMLPELVSLGIQQRLSDQWTAYGTVEFTNWDRVGTVPIKGDGGANIDVLELNYQDGWFYALGLEYKYNDKWTFRTGLAYEETPIVDEERNVFLPDADRVWLSLGATHKYSDRITVDFAYTHIFAEDTEICRQGGVVKGVGTAVPCTDDNPNNDLIRAKGEASVDIVSASLKMKMGHVQEPLEPLK